MNMSRCKICSGNTHYYNTCDFNKTIEFKGVQAFEPSGIDIIYDECDDCGFIFTSHFDQWDSIKFSADMYNEDYELTDPEWDGTRARRDAETVKELFEPCSVLDYGGGAGYLAEYLRSNGFKAQSYDPFVAGSEKPTNTFDMVTCFEVFEHTIDPLATLEECISFLRSGGRLFISTLLVDFLKDGPVHNPIKAADGASFIAPRNGHISIHTKRSLDVLLHRLGLEIVPDVRIPKDMYVEGLDRFFIAKFKK
jgi:SAM-dependent methyltransferase